MERADKALEAANQEMDLVIQALTYLVLYLPRKPTIKL